MTLHLGYIPASTTLYIPFHTFDSNGASITITGLAVTDVELYKNGSVTQRSSDAGYALLDTDGIDFDGITGIHGISIDLADNTDAGFYSAGAFYWVVISAITVDTRTVNFVLATFYIGPVAANATQILGTAISTPATAGVMDVNVKNINNVAAATPGAAGGVFIAGTNAATSVTTALTANITGNLSGSVGSVTGAVGSVTGAVGSVTGNVGGNVTGSVGSVVGAVGSVTGAVGSVTGNVGGNVVGSVASVTAIVTANATQLAGQTITAAAGVTFPTSVASPTNITAGTITTVTNLTNSPTAGDLTATMKTSVQTAATAALAAFFTTSVQLVTDIWAAAVRTLTAGTNIVLAKGVGVTGFTDLSAAQVNAEVVDALNVDTYAEPTGVPAATAPITTKLGYLHMALRNQLDVTATKKIFYDDGGAAEWEKDLSDDGTTYSETEAN